MLCKNDVKPTYVGKVSAEERDEIQRLYERKVALKEMVYVIADRDVVGELENNKLYEKITADLGETERKFQKWWNDMVQKYNWKRAEKGQWVIDFESCDVILQSFE